MVKMLLKVLLTCWNLRISMIWSLERIFSRSSGMAKTLVAAFSATGPSSPPRANQYQRRHGRRAGDLQQARSLLRWQQCLGAQNWDGGIPCERSGGHRILCIPNACSLEAPTDRTRLERPQAIYSLRKMVSM